MAMKFYKKAIHNTEICKKQAQKTSKFDQNKPKNKQPASLQKTTANLQKIKPKFAGKPQGCRGVRRTESEIFDSDSAPALAEYTPTLKHFQVLDSDSCLNSKVNYLNFWQCLNDSIRFSH